MNKLKCIIIYTKVAQYWSVHLGCPINATINGLLDKNSAKLVADTIRKSYQCGVYQEFVDNNNKTNTLMERFGL